jgi:uncharacterized repeat protein (TIGR04138 family)
MSSPRDFSEVIEQIRKEHPQFEKGAYFFVRQALDHTLKAIKKESEARSGRHVSGQELLSGIQEFALDQYGPMAYTLLQGWGLKQCADFGEIVFQLVEYGVLGKTDQDRREDFAQGYDFKDAFVRPFEPAKTRPTPAVLRPEEPEQ